MKRIVLLSFLLGLLFVACEPLPPAPKPKPKGTVGGTYQLARTSSETVICTSEETYAKYRKFARDGNIEKAQEMIVDELKAAETIVREEKDIGECCIAISSHSETTILEKGESTYKAEFAAWPHQPMWAHMSSLSNRVR